RTRLIARHRSLNGLWEAGGAAIHPIAHALGLEGLPIRFLPVRLVAVEHALLAGTSCGSWVMSATPAWVAVTLWTRPCRSVPTCSFMPKYQVFPLRVCFHLGIARLGGVLRRAGRGDDRRVDDRPALQQQSVRGEQLLDGLEDRRGQVVKPFLSAKGGPA